MLSLNYTYRLYPNQGQQNLLTDWLETCRYLYNRCLEDLKLWLGSRVCSINKCSLISEYIVPPFLFPDYLSQQRELTQWKKDNPFYQDVHAQVLQGVVKRLHNTWETFRKRGYGFPRFKKYGQFKSFYFPQFRSSPIEGQFIRLPKIGNVRFNLHRPIPDGFTIKGVRIVSKARRTIWYVIITIQSDVTIPNTPPHGRAIGVDTGLEKFLATSDGLIVKPAQFFRDMQSRLKVLQRKASRKKKHSSNYEKAQQKVARLHHDIDNSRKNFHFQEAHKLCSQAGMVFFEDLDYRVSAKGFLGKQMLDGGFGQFRQIVKWVCWKRGVYFSEVNAKGTSKVCPDCGFEWSNDLSIRAHQCNECGYAGDRDIASAQVIKKRGEASIVRLDKSEWKLSADSVLPGQLLGKCYAETLDCEVKIPTL